MNTSMNAILAAAFALLLAAGTCLQSRAATILFNFGSTEAGNWNNIIDENSLTGTGPARTFTGIVDDAGAPVAGVALEVYSAVGLTALAPKISTLTYSEDWLTSTASQSAMFLLANGAELRLRLLGIEEGMYSVELYAFTDSAAYAHDVVTIYAGVSGSTTTTTSDFDTLAFDAGGPGADSQDVLAKWSSIAVGSGQELEILIDGGDPNESPLISAVQISFTPVPEPGTLAIGFVVVGAVSLRRHLS